MSDQSTRFVVASSLNVRTGFSNPHDYSQKQSLLLTVCFSTHLYVLLSSRDVHHTTKPHCYLQCITWNLFLRLLQLKDNTSLYVWSHSKEHFNNTGLIIVYHFQDLMSSIGKTQLVHPIRLTPLWPALP